MFGRLKAAVVGAFYAGVILGCVLGPISALAQTRPATLTPTNPKFSTVAVGKGVPTTNIPIFSRFTVNGQVQNQLWCDSDGTSAYCENLIKVGTTNPLSFYYGGEGPLSSDAYGLNRAYLIANCATASNCGMDFSSNQAGATYRFHTGTAASGTMRMIVDSNGIRLANTPNNVTAGVDDTTTVAGDLNRTRYQATITPAAGGAGNCGAAFQAAALTADCVVATLPAGAKLIGVYADVTAGFTCSGTCTGTKVLQCGTAAGGVQILAAGLNVAVTGQFGLADADLGSGMTRAAAIQGGLLNSWSATTPVSCRFTSGTGNWGSGAATFVNAGSVKFTLITEQEK